jgi:pantoate--beta-alanine ligase
VEAGAGDFIAIEGETPGKMRIVNNLKELRSERASLKGSFGLVPTMGALHEGHASLVRRATAECDHAGVSIFVNPSQFGPGEDLDKYPRTLQRDLEMLDKLGVAVVFTPIARGMYPSGYQTWIDVEEVTLPLEGAGRPGHFRGVVTVVAKLVNSFLPDKAYFGQKDAQQVAVIRRMVHDLNFPVEIVVCPTVRETDGLALSSRNAYLGPEERRAATVLYRALVAAKNGYDAGERDGAFLRLEMQSVIDSEPLATAEYISAADPGTLTEYQEIVSEKGVLFSMAVKIGKTRLIDNLLLQPDNPEP